MYYYIVLVANFSIQEAEEISRYGYLMWRTLPRPDPIRPKNKNLVKERRYLLQFCWEVENYDGQTTVQASENESWRRRRRALDNFSMKKRNNRETVKNTH